MKTREAAIYEWINGFEIPAYPVSSTPDQADYPYITYNLVIGDFYNEVSMQVDVWYYTESESAINAKVREIESAITGGRNRIAYDGGGILLFKGSPWAQAVQDTDNAVKRRYINLDMQFITL